MIGCMLADKIYDRHHCPMGIVQIGETIGQTVAEMQQGARRFSCHACIAIRRTCRYTFEKTEYASHLIHAVQGRDEVHLRGARVSKANLDTSAHQCAK